MNSVRSTDKVGLIPGPKDRVPTIRWHNGDIGKFNPISEKLLIKKLKAMVITDMLM